MKRVSYELRTHTFRNEGQVGQVSTNEEWFVVKWVREMKEIGVRSRR